MGDVLLFAINLMYGLTVLVQCANLPPFFRTTDQAIQYLMYDEHDISGAFFICTYMIEPENLVRNSELKNLVFKRHE